MLATANQVHGFPEVLASLRESGAGEGDLVCLEVQKKGVRRRGQTHDDDTVATLVWTGFDYRLLIERSLRKLTSLQKHLITDLLTACNEQGVQAELSDVCAAIQETISWFHRVLAQSNTLHLHGELPQDPSVWQPLYVNGQVVKGCRVWNGIADPDRPDSPIPGTVYLQGVKLGEVIVTPAASHWVPKSSKKTLAKDILRSWLPIGLYVQYALVPGSVGVLRAGPDAAQYAKQAGIVVEPGAIRSLFRIA